MSQVEKTSSPAGHRPTADNRSLADSSLRRKQAVLDLLADTIGDAAGGDAAREGAQVRIPISGQCMEPLILDGDQISVKPLLALPGPGDIVLARTQDDELVCHRILSRTGPDYLLAGDRTFRLDVHPPDSLLGRVVAVHRGSKTLKIYPAGPLARCQASLHLQSRTYRGQSRARLFEWPRRILIMIQGWRWRL